MLQRLSINLVCRACLKSENLIPLISKEEDEKNMVRAFRLTTGLKISRDDGLPQSICRGCANFIECAIKFRSKCKAVQKELLKCNKYEFAVNIKPENRKENSLISEQNQIVLEANVDDADIEQKDENIAQSHDNDILSFCDTDENPNSLPSSERIETRKHVVSNTRPYLDLIEGSKESKGPIKCKICKKTSKTMNAFVQHSKTHFGYEVLCEFCARRCISQLQLLRHQRAKHGLARDNSFACSYCEFQALDKEQLLSHERRTHTKERPYVCDECGEAFYTKRVLIQHGYCHKTEKPFQCDLCPSKFKLRSVLTSHKNTTHCKRYAYGCYICSKTFNKPYAVRRHISKMHGIPNSQQEKVPRFNKEDLRVENVNCR